MLIVALNQASAQFTPRVLRNFMGDRPDASSIVLPGNAHQIFTSPNVANAERARDAVLAFLKAR